MRNELKRGKMSILAGQCNVDGIKGWNQSFWKIFGWRVPRSEDPELKKNVKKKRWFLSLQPPKHIFKIRIFPGFSGLLHGFLAFDAIKLYFFPLWEHFEARTNIQFHKIVGLRLSHTVHTQAIILKVWYQS